MTKTIVLFLKNNENLIIPTKVECKTVGKPYINKKTNLKMTKYSYHHPFLNKDCEGKMPALYF